MSLSEQHLLQEAINQVFTHLRQRRLVVEFEVNVPWLGTSGTLQKPRPHAVKVWNSNLDQLDFLE